MDEDRLSSSLLYTSLGSS